MINFGLGRIFYINDSVWNYNDKWFKILCII